MTPEQFQSIRGYFGLQEPDWMYALGYQGNRNTLFQNCRRYESGEREIPPYLAQYVWLLWQASFGKPVPLDSGTKMPVWPMWPHYYDLGEGEPAAPDSPP